MNDEKKIVGRELIEAERLEQVAKGWTSGHDDSHRNDELAAAGHCYARAANYEMHTGRVMQRTPAQWPFAPTFWKPNGGPVRLLTKSGAFYIANMERLERIASKKSREQAKRCAELAHECAELIDQLQAGTWPRPDCHHRRVIVTMEVYGPDFAADALMKAIGAGIGLDWLNHMVTQTPEGAAVGYVDFNVAGELWSPREDSTAESTEDTEG